MEEAHPRARLAQHPPGSCLVERGERGGLGEPGDAADLLEGEARAEHRARPDKGTGVRAEAGQPLGDQVAHGGGQ